MKTLPLGAISTLIFVSLLTAPTLRADVTLTLDVSREGGEANGEKNSKKNSQYELKVHLGESRITTQSEGNIYVRDFADKRIYISKDDGFMKLSLFSEIGFRVAEFQNRMRLGNVLQQAENQSPLTFWERVRK